MILIQKGLLSRESSCVHAYCVSRDIPFRVVQQVDYNPSDTLVGTVEWIEKIMGVRIRPNYFPDPLRNLIASREIFWVDHLEFKNNYSKYFGLFAKPADRYKAFDGQIVDESNFQEIINSSNNILLQKKLDFIQEWRYYIKAGRVLCSGWYQGNDDDESAPDINFNLPNDFHMAVDVGRLSNGQLELVECCHPYAVGWYGEYSETGKYIEFLTP